MGGSQPDPDRQKVGLQLPPHNADAGAFSQGTHSADVILNILTRKRDTALPVTIMTPEALRLRHVPVADCARYDSLRRTI